MSSEEGKAVEVLEPVWAEQIEVTHSPTIGKLVEALAKAQLKFQPILKQTDNAAFMRAGKASKYADLAAYIDATQKALAEEGLVVMQWPDVSPEAKSMSLTSILAHTSGEWMRGKLTLPAIGRDGFTPQSCGSSITYARRYTLSAIIGAASEDDDGNAASGRGTVEAAQAVAKAKIAAAKEPASQLRAVTITLPESHNGNVAHVSGYTADEPMRAFFRDVDAKLKSGPNGMPYFRMAAEYLKDFTALCERLEIEIK